MRRAKMEVRIKKKHKIKITRQRSCVSNFALEIEKFARLRFILFTLMSLEARSWRDSIFHLLSRITSLHQ